MKYRFGFVSNSSSSSFLVSIGTSHLFPLSENTKQFLVEKEDIPKLEKYGFEKCNRINPSHCSDISSLSIGKNNFISMKYDISCNQDEVILFLVKNNIPFRANCHYGHQYVSYQRDSDYILFAYNFGKRIETYGEDRLEFEDLSHIEPIKKIPKEEWLSYNDYLERDDETL